MHAENFDVQKIWEVDWERKRIKENTSYVTYVYQNTIARYKSCDSVDSLVYINIYRSCSEFKYTVYN